MRTMSSIHAQSSAPMCRYCPPTDALNVTKSYSRKERPPGSAARWVGSVAIMVDTFKSSFITKIDMASLVHGASCAPLGAQVLHKMEYGAWQLHAMVGSCSLCKGPTMHIPCRTSSCASEQSTPRLHRSLALSPEFSSQGSAKKLCTSTGPYLGGRDPSRRQAIKHAMAAPAAFLLAQLAAPSSSHAFPGFKKDLTSKRRVKIPESEFKAGPEGLKYYDVSPGKGPEAHEGQRVVVHFDAKCVSGGWNWGWWCGSGFLDVASRIH